MFNLEKSQLLATKHSYSLAYGTFIVALAMATKSKDAENDHEPLSPSALQKKRRHEYEKRVRGFMSSLKPQKKAKAEADASATHCPICTEKYSVRHKRLTCPYSCGGEACMTCHVRYLQDATTDFHCMKCRREWTLRFMRTHFSDKQLQTLYKQYQKVLLARDEIHLPQAQQVIEDEHEIAELERTVYRLEHEIRRAKEKQVDLRAGRRRKLERKQKEGPPVKCPTADCRGYLKRSICGVCQKRYCLKCMQQVGRPAQRRKKQKFEQKQAEDDAGDSRSSDSSSDSEDETKEVAPQAASVVADPVLSALKDHVCRPEDLANMEYLRANSKMCPKCGVWTSRTEGCDQMWCISCHAAWNWSTGQEVQGVIHNPHFFEWQRRTQGNVERNPLDVMCGGLPFAFPHRQFDDALWLNRVLRMVNEINDQRILRPPREPTNLDVQVKYLRKKIHREAWSHTIFRRHKLFKFQEQFFHIHQMFYLAATDILQRRYNNIIDAAAARTELENLRLYYNRELLETVRVNKGRYQKFYRLVSKDWSAVNWEHDATVKETLAADV